MRNAAQAAKAFRFCTSLLVNMVLSSSLPEPSVERTSIFRFARFMSMAPTATAYSTKAQATTHQAPLALTDDQLDQIMRHATVLRPQLRRVFVERVVYELRGRRSAMAWSSEPAPRC